MKRLFCTQSRHVYFVEFGVKCNVCYTLSPKYTFKMYAAMSNDSEDTQVNFISISAR